MALHVVGIADCRVSKDPSDVLVTHALGSCIGVTLYDPVARVAGLLHFMLPECSLDPDAAAQRPFLFADTGIPLLLQLTGHLGAVTARSVVMAAGGAQMLDGYGTFNIGQRNQDAVRTIFKTAGILIKKEEMGGASSRTLRIDVARGEVQLSTSGGVEFEMVFDAKKTGGGDGLHSSTFR